MARAGVAGCVALSALACAASLVWILTSPSGPAAKLDTDAIFPTSLGFTQRLLVGGAGALIGVGLGLVGYVAWPRRPARRAHTKDISLATYDSVTGLPSRRLFLVLLSQALSRAQGTGRIVAVLVAELEQFRPLPTSAMLSNLTLVVRVQAARIKSALQSHDTVARLGERTFAVIVDNLLSADQALPIARKIQSTMSLPLFVEGQELLLSCRIGGAVAPFHGTAGEILLDAASQLLSHSQRDDDSIQFLSDPTALPAEAQPQSDHVTVSSGSRR